MDYSCAANAGCVADETRPVEALVAAQRCDLEMERLVERNAMQSCVWDLLLAKGTSGLPSRQVTARLPHMTPQTAHRRLVQEGTSYSQILEDVRFALALKQLQTARRTIWEIAGALRYTDVANFRHAFRRQKGAPPQHRSPEPGTHIGTVH